MSCPPRATPAHGRLPVLHRLLALLVLTATLATPAAHAAARASLSLPGGLPEATDAATAPPGRAVALTAWWRGFEDPALDLLIRAALQGPAAASVPAQDLTQQVGTLYVTARWLAAKRLLVQQLQDVLAQRRHWAALDGPTPQAAQALAQIDQAAADLNQQLAGISARSADTAAELRRLSPLPADTMNGLLGELMTQKTVPRFELAPQAQALPAARSLAPQTARVQALEQAGLALGARLDAARKALEAGSTSPRAVLQIYERLLLDTDQVLQAQAELAMGWVQLLAHGDRPDFLCRAPTCRRGQP